MTVGSFFSPPRISNRGFTFSYKGTDVIKNDNYSTPAYSGNVFPEYPAPPYTGFKEHDLYLSYEETWHDIFVKPMLLAYTGYRVDLVFRQPFYAVAMIQLAYPIIGPLKAYTIETAGIDRLEGAYFGEFGTSLEQKIGRMTVNASVEVGVGFKY